ncbi:MAG: TrbI/VirB10 family protein [Acidiphilium sp.]|nr:TrbI/VirB10 family protein [Acidiphilium sp.]
MSIFRRMRANRSARRTGIIGGIIAVVLGVGAWHEVGGKKAEPVKVAASALPDTDASPGGDQATPYIRNVTTEEIRRKALAAAHQNRSATAILPPAVTAPSSEVDLPSPVLPAPQPAATIPVSYQKQPVAGVTDPPPSLNIARYNAYNTALGSLKDELPGPSYATHVYVKSDPQPPRPPASGLSGGSANMAARVVATAASGPSPTPAETVLIPADHGIYGETLTGVSSDQSGGTVIVQAESGPIARDRMSGRFTTAGDRLVVKLDRLSLQDGQSVPIDALVVAPNSMQEAVATSVDHHYAERFVLPIAAAFVEGLGQAIESANSVIQESALGGVTQFNHLNLGQSLGVAAGTAGQTAGQLIQNAAPHGPTVELAADADVGILFLKPVKAPAGEH